MEMDIWGGERQPLLSAKWGLLRTAKSTPLPMPNDPKKEKHGRKAHNCAK